MNKKSIFDFNNPQFHEGQCIINSTGNPLFVLSINEDGYHCEDVTGNEIDVICNYSDNDYHLWTIEDARNNDILFAEIERDELEAFNDDLPLWVNVIFIYENVNDAYKIHSQCDVYYDGIVHVHSRVFFNDFIRNIRPATHKERTYFEKRLDDYSYNLKYTKDGVQLSRKQSELSFKIEEGKSYICTKDVIMNTGEVAYRMGKTYKCDYDWNLTDESNDADHKWDKYPDDPEDDYRLYFKPVVEEKIRKSKFNEGQLINYASDSTDVVRVDRVFTDGTIRIIRRCTPYYWDELTLEEQDDWVLYDESGDANEKIEYKQGDVVSGVRTYNGERIYGTYQREYYPTPKKKEEGVMVAQILSEGKYYDVFPDSLRPLTRFEKVCEMLKYNSGQSSKTQEIDTVAALVDYLKTCDQSAKICIGDSFDNRLSISWSGAEGCTKEDCDYICFDIKGKEEKEHV